MYEFKIGDRVIINDPSHKGRHGQHGVVVEVSLAIDAALVSTETSTIWVSRFNLVADES